MLSSNYFRSNFVNKVDLYGEIALHNIMLASAMVSKRLPISMVEVYTVDDREKLVGYNIFIVVPLGESMAGKTTLLR